MLKQAGFREMPKTCPECGGALKDHDKWSMRCKDWNCRKGISKNALHPVQQSHNPDHTLDDRDEAGLYWCYSHSLPASKVICATGLSKEVVTRFHNRMRPVAAFAQECQNAQAEFAPEEMGEEVDVEVDGAVSIITGKHTGEQTNPDKPGQTRTSRGSCPQQRQESPTTRNTLPLPY